ncbi:hypothetical protein [Brevibacillus choshinensis]|uniref:NEAT domain-containing protein n=1 Tax=Brevibacillus choshinensis TaxID=54911 RepID=A0ABX7FV34_BRECH|nr:hypothetical protein [Brevibacillus choshinensis]QRG70114.1 hypothetical protein JNE38_13935 [Brevibacillus choshinensis]
MQWKLTKKAIWMLLCAMLTGVFGEFAHAAESESAAGVSITKFALLEKKFDKTGSAEFKPDGTRDGHFQVSLTFSQKTVVNAIILRSTDVFGKENYHGIWRTNRVGVGWLLGIVQGDKVITPAFRPSPNDPVGTFEGTVSFDLFANDNGTMKEGQYYVLEIETPEDTIISQPITFGEPSNGSASGGTNGSAGAGTTPNPNPAPTPAPSPVPVTDLTITGGQGTITVQGAVPGAMITLFQDNVCYGGANCNYNYFSNYGSKTADSKGSIVFSKLPSKGGKYYVTESVNGERTRTSAEATVTDEKTADLLRVDSTGGYVTFVKGTTPQVRLNLYGFVLDSEIKSVDVSYAGVSSTVPVNDKKSFVLQKNFDLYSPLDIVTVTAKGANGQKHVMYIKLGYDMFDDKTVKAERNGKEVTLTARNGTIRTSALHVYLLDGNKLIPLDGKVEHETELSNSMVTGYQVKFTTEKATQDIRLLVEIPDSVIEIVPIMP